MTGDALDRDGADGEHDSGDETDGEECERATSGRAGTPAQRAPLDCSTVLTVYSMITKSSVSDQFST